MFQKEALQIVAVGAVSHAPCCLFKLFFRNVSHAKGDLLETSDLETLPLLDDLDKVGGLYEGFVSPCVQPRNPAAQFLYVERIFFDPSIIFVFKEFSIKFLK